MDKIIQDLKKRLDNLENFIQFNLKNKAFGQLYQDDAGGSITITSAGTYYPLLSGWSAGLYNLLTLTAAAGTITAEERSAGTFLVGFQICGSVAHNLTEMHVAVFKNGIKQPQACAEVYFQNASSELSCSAIGIISLTEGDDLDLRLTSNRSAEVIDISHCQLTAYRIR